MPTHTPSNKLQLRALIQHAIERDGPGCDLSGIDVSRITDFSYTFMNLSFFGNVSTWRMTQAQTVRNMFEKAILSTDLSAWDTSNVEDFSAMFEHASGRVGDIGLWNTRSARNMSAMFAHSSLGADLRYWDVGHVRNFARMFQCYTKPLHVSEWNTSSATLLSGMFEGACIEEDLSRWTVSNVLSFHGMFAHSNFKGAVSRWDVNKGQNFGHMFEGSPFCGDLSQWVFGDGLSSVAFDKSIDAQVFARLPACVVLCIGTGHGQQASPSACVGWTPPMRSFWRCTSACNGADTARFVCAIATCTNPTMLVPNAMGSSIKRMVE